MRGTVHRGPIHWSGGYGEHVGLRNDVLYHLFLFRIEHFDQAVVELRLLLLQTYSH